MKYNINDKLFNKSCVRNIFNPYHRNFSFRSMFSEVKNANNEVFTNKENCSLGYITHQSRSFIYKQENGSDLESGADTYLHLYKDYTLIKTIITEEYEKNLNILKKREEDKIHSLELQMQELQNEIIKLKENGLVKERFFLKESHENALNTVTKEYHFLIKP
jgi:hypothetical protein